MPVKRAQHIVETQHQSAGTPRQIPRSPSMRATSAFSARSARSASAITCALAARENSFFSTAVPDRGRAWPAPTARGPAAWPRHRARLAVGAGDKTEQAIFGHDFARHDVTASRPPRLRTLQSVLRHSPSGALARARGSGVRVSARHGCHQASAGSSPSPPSSAASSSDQFLDPADLDARLHDDGVGVVAGEIEAFQRAGNPHALSCPCWFRNSRSGRRWRSRPGLPAS